MELSKTSYNIRNWIISIAGIVAVILLLIIIFIKNNNENTHITKAILVPTEEPVITPTIFPSSRIGWKTFVLPNPKAKYSFDYPQNWGIVEIGHSNLVRLNFAGHCRVEFSAINNVNDRSVGEETKEEKTIAGKSYQLTTLKNNSIPYSEIYNLTNPTSKDGFVQVTVDLPVSNVDQCQQIVDQILSSVKSGK